MVTTSNTSEGREPSHRFVLLTPYDGNNFGDAAIQEALIANFRKYDPAVQLCGITLDPALTSERHGIPCYPLARIGRPHYQPKLSAPSSASAATTTAASGAHAPGIWQRLRRLLRSLKPFKILVRLGQEASHIVRSYRLLRTCDALVVAGGGQLDEEWGGAWGHPYSLFKWSLLASIAGCGVVFLSVGACRMESSFTRTFLRRALTWARYRSYRDAGSKALAMQLTNRAEGDVVPDIAFSLPLAKQDKPIRAGDVIRVAVSPIAYARPGFWPTENQPLYDRYLGELASFVSTLLQRGVSVTLFSSAQPDDQIFPDLRSRLSPGLEEETLARLTEQDVHSLGDLMSLLQSVDIVVSSRLHGIMLSFIAGCPAIAISYDRKVTRLMEDTGQSAYCQDIQSFTSDELLAAFSRLHAEAARVKKQLDDVCRQNDTLLQQQYSLITQNLDRQGARSLRMRVSTDVGRESV